MVLFKHGDVIVRATTACLRARLRTAPIRSRERQRVDAQLLMTFCLERSLCPAMAFLGGRAAEDARRERPRLPNCLPRGRVVAIPDL